jgi:superfamily II DNA/RNA helicase
MLLATDVAARGLDIQKITHVVHYDLANDTTQYIHRSGRTGRFGAKGTVINIVTEREERELKQFLRELATPLSRKEFYEGKIVDYKPMKKEERRK